LISSSASLETHTIPQSFYITFPVLFMSEYNNCVKRTYRDYTMSFKLQIDQEIEPGQLTTTKAIKKYGIQCRKTAVQGYENLLTWFREPISFEYTPPEQKIMDLEAQVKLFEKQKALLEQQVNLTLWTRKLFFLYVY